MSVFRSLVRWSSSARVLAAAVLLAALAADHFAAPVRAEDEGVTCTSDGQCFEDCEEATAPSCTSVCSSCGDGYVPYNTPGVTCNACAFRTCSCGPPIFEG
jgi:hypothetical protein